MKPIGAKVIERPLAPLFSIETCRQHCEIVPIATDSDGTETHPDDALIMGMLDGAVAHAEKFTGRSILLRTYEFALDGFPRSRWGSRSMSLQPVIEIPYPPLIEVISFTYGDDSDGVLTEGTDFIVDTYNDKATLRSLSSWPAIATPAPNRVVCRYRAGYQSEQEPDSDAEPLPGNLRAAILLTLYHLYENRSASTEKAMAELPLGVEAMLRPDRVLTGMA
jgi:uncharacterized phiE125 gp8 family phage protein